MTVSLLAARDALIRRDFRAFLMKVYETLHPGSPPLGAAWYLDAMCHALSEVRSGQGARLAISVPPRHLKSITTAVAFACWVLGHDPASKIIVVSYSQELARIHSGNAREVLESEWYRRAFPGTRISLDGNRLNDLVTTRGGYRRAVSVEGTLTGIGADLIILDDCAKADDAMSPAKRESLRGWYDNTLVSRLNSQTTGSIISIQQRLHEDDLPAYLLEKGFDHLNLPAIAERVEQIPTGPNRFFPREPGDLLDPVRFDQATLARLRRDLGPMVFSAQYQQDPVAPEGNQIQIAWFGTYQEAPPRHEFLKVIQSWDTGMSDDPRSDWSVCTTWGFHRTEQRWYLLDVFRGKLAFPDLVQAAKVMHRRFTADAVLIEHAGSGMSLCHQLRVDTEIPFVPIRPGRSKEDRLIGCLAEIEAGRFLIPAEAPWLDAFRKELKAFPAGKNDDQVDSLSQFVHFQRARWSQVLQEYTPTGRPLRAIRQRRRPF